ncbi:MAG: penicillin-binding protein 1A [Snowella sp.]|nr:penicillin-binding protein 1A [Snowella sp.]
MFKQLTHTLKKKTSQVLHSVAEALERDQLQPVNSVNSSAEPIVTPSLETRLQPDETNLSSLNQTESSVNSATLPELAATVTTGSQNSDTTSPSSVSAPAKKNRRRERRRTLKLPKLSTNEVSKDSKPSKFKQITQHPRFWLFLGMGVGVSSSAIALGWGIYKLEQNTQVAVEDVLTYAPEGTLTIKAKNGTVLQEIGPVSHDKVKANAIPPLVSQAFIASEDRRFREHRGVDLQGIMRALFSNIQAGDVVEGGSTITQQLARLVFLNQDRNFGRKIREIRLAQKIEDRYTKDEILQQYLNLIYLGSGAYGVADAAHAYFSKPPEKLTLTEAATLAGIVPAPSRYSPLENKELATKRRNEVLNKMADAGFITRAQAQTAILEPLNLKPSPLKRFNREAPYFTDYILKELPKYVPESQIKAGGLTVETTLNANWQKHAEEVVSQAIAKYGQWQRFSEAALVTIDPKTGAIFTMVGGKDYKKTQFNHVTQAKRQPGSTFKPILYATAIAAGISPNKTYPNVPFTINGYTPENYGDTYTGGAMSLRQALASSVNVVAVRLLLDVGWNPVIKLARQMGIESKLEPTYSLALGAWEMTPLEMTSAYGTFANNGVHVKPYAITQILDRQGKVLYKTEVKTNRALDPDSNAIMTSMMRTVVTSGTGRPAQLGDRQVAGKTGTSDKARDLWFIGYIPQLVTGVWLGNGNNAPTKGASTTAAMIWQQVMVDAVKGMPVQYFPALPKKIEGRKPTIKAEPLRSKGLKVLAIAPAAVQGRNAITNSPSDGTTQPRRRRRRRSLSNTNTDNNQRTDRDREQPTETRRSRRRRSRRTSEETAQGNSSVSRRSARRSSRRSNAPSSSSASSGNSSLPAPPAAKKEE